MPRRHGWLHDYGYHLDQGDDRVVRDRRDMSHGHSSAAPVNVNVNINLGDLLSQLIRGTKTQREALEEMVTEMRKLELLEQGMDGSFRKMASKQNRRI